MTHEACIAPDTPGVRCQSDRAPGSLFCRRHEQAPAAKRGGWLSAELRRRKRAAGDLDASNISPKLWIGSRPPVDRDMPAFDVVVLCAVEFQPEIAFHGTVIRCPLNDAQLSLTELSYAVGASRAVAGALAGDKRVLVTCYAGLNRSALVASLALGQLTTLSADDIMALIRTRRNSSALSNPYFQDVLRKMIGGGRSLPQRVAGSRRRRR